MNNEQITETQGATATENTQRVVDISNYVWCKAEIRVPDTCNISTNKRGVAGICQLGYCKGLDDIERCNG